MINPVSTCMVLIYKPSLNTKLYKVLTV